MIRKFRCLPALFLALPAFVSCQDEQAVSSEPEEEKEPGVLLVPDESNLPDNAVKATLAGGCFWCVEEVFQQTPGVLAVISGYIGGKPDTANYEAVCSGKTDHAEAVEVYFDPEITTYEAVIERFWEAHDPTQLNRQGPDQGRQYRSGIFYHSEEQRAIAEASKSKLAASGKHGSKPIVTEITRATEFHVAEDYHQNYARLNPGNRYLHAQLWPKLEKLKMQIPTGTGARQIKGSAPR